VYFNWSEASLPERWLSSISLGLTIYETTLFHHRGVDQNGNVYVAWMDNRYGEFGTTDKDYWHVFRSRSTNQGANWSLPIRVSGTTDINTSASIGGYGNPFGFHEKHLPPGDFLTCDADVDHLYVAWPDSRANQNMGHENDPTRVYFRRIQF
jgi:hypothetical protein